jgi:hypothetical protein
MMFTYSSSAITAPAGASEFAADHIDHKIPVSPVVPIS